MRRAGPIPLLITFIFIVSFGLVLFNRLKDSGYIFATETTQFELDTSQLDKPEADGRHPVIVLNDDGTVKYLSEDFDGYGGRNSLLIESFDRPDRIKVSSAAAGSFSLSPYEGVGGYCFALRYEEGKVVTVSGELKDGIDIARWDDAGYITVWLKVMHREGIESVTLRLIDAEGNEREYLPVRSTQTDVPNAYDRDDLFTDIEFPEKTHSGEWTDYSLEEGWNFVFWRSGEGYFRDTGDFTPSAVERFELGIRTTDRLRGQFAVFDDLRIQDGLQKEANSLGGHWYAPLGMPQYGVFDVNDQGDGDYALKLLNVRQSQYPSNGDHGRILSRYGTPEKFAMRVRFSLNGVGIDGDLTNTWFRVLYDFDPDYDPGHDWFGSYMSLEFAHHGLITVIPVERFVSQDYEPKEEGGETGSRKHFMPEENKVYEYNLTVNRDSAKASVYEVNDGRLIFKQSLDYVFDRSRYGDRRYPFGLEVTGDAKATVYEIELIDLTKWQDRSELK